MFIITGKTSFRKELGRTVEKRYCQHCGETSKYHVVRLIDWFTLFGVPVFPIGIEYNLLCPHCDTGERMDEDTTKELLNRGTRKDIEIIK